MKDIDFLPEWYKSGRRRQISYRTQCYVLGGMFVVMIVWNFVTSYSTSKANAQVLEMTTRQKQAEKVSAKLIELKKEMNLYHKREGLVEKIDPKINIASVLAELSYLVDERIVLSNIELISEKFTEEEPSLQANVVVRAVQSKFNTKLDLPLGNVRFKVLLAGVAGDAGDVAGLICKLENSPYFSQVVLSFSKNMDMKRESFDYPDEQKRPAPASITGPKGDSGSEGKIQVSKFQISCYLANYLEQ